ncbi:polyadenylate-binding protein 2 isoform X2 [Lates japonicus]
MTKPTHPTIKEEPPRRESNLWWTETDCRSVRVCVSVRVPRFQDQWRLTTPPQVAPAPPHCLCSVSLSLCSRYAHSPHLVRVGRRGRGAGRPQAHGRGHLLQQQTLMMLLVLFTLTQIHT